VSGPGRCAPRRGTVGTRRECTPDGVRAPSSRPVRVPRRGLPRRRRHVLSRLRQRGDRRATRLMCELVGTGRLSAVCQQTERNPSTHDGPEHTKCLVRHGMDAFHRSLKVETRVRTPLGVLTVEPQVAARFVSLTWGFLVSGDHLVVSGSCHSVQPMMGRGPEIVPNLCPDCAHPPGHDPTTTPPVWPPGQGRALAGVSRRNSVDRVCTGEPGATVGRRVAMAAERLGSTLATRRCAQRSGVPAPFSGSSLTSRRSAARGTTTRRPSLMLGSSPPRTSW
jgi:hypothetical protein